MMRNTPATVFTGSKHRSHEFEPVFVIDGPSEGWATEWDLLVE
jgi:hypothetical protein